MEHNLWQRQRLEKKGVKGSLERHLAEVVCALSAAGRQETRLGQSPKARKGYTQRGQLTLSGG